VPNLVHIRSRGLLGEWVKCDQKFIYLFIHALFGNSPTRQTRRQIFQYDGSNNADSRKDVPFLGFVDIAPHLDVKSLQNPNFGGMNRRFQAKLAKSKNMLHRFQPDFAQ